MSSLAAACWHCGEPMPLQGGCVALVAGLERPMCCNGCRAAALWIEQLGLGDYYRLRAKATARAGAGGPDAARSSSSPFRAWDTALPPGTSASPPGQSYDAGTGWEAASLQRHVLRAVGDDLTEVMLLVDGVRCAACVWLIERALGSVAGVTTVQVNATARRARVVFDPRRTGLPQLLQTLSRAGYRPLPLDRSALDDARKRESRDALKRLLVAGFGAMQSMMYASALYFGAVDPMDDATRGLFRWLGFLVATPVVLYSAQPFFAGAVRSLRAGRMGMDVPVALAVAMIYAASLYVAVLGGAEVYFDSVSMFVFFLLCGRHVEMRARHRAGDMTDAIARLTPAFADRRRPDGTLERVAAIDLVPGARVNVSAGEAVPADGTLESEHCLVDESLLSGESTPVAKRRGDPLVAGSLVTEGPAEIRVDRVGVDTALAAIVALVTRAQVARPRLAQTGERAAGLFVARILALTGLTAAIWSYFDPSRAFDAAIAVLVVSCPCAFALAVPAALTRTLAVLARRGVLVVKPDAIETLAGATHVVFDKTGTLTDRRLRVERVQVLAAGCTETDALRQAAALARESRHPASQAIVAAAVISDKAAPADVSHPPLVAARAVARAGAGMEATIEGRLLRLGRPDFALGAGPVARDEGVSDEVTVPADIADAVVLAGEHGAIAAFHLGEQLRPAARQAIDALGVLGLQVEILSGDAAQRVADVAKALGVDNWRARQLPQDKLARLAQLRSEGARVVVVGDGVNDAPILAGADVAVAMSSGADIAQASSDIVLAGESLPALAGACALVRQTSVVLRQNQRWAITYNLAAVPLAALGFVPPWLAAIGMSVSSLLVVLNAMRIGRADQRRFVRDGLA